MLGNGMIIFRFPNAILCNIFTFCFLISGSCKLYLE